MTHLFAFTFLSSWSISSPVASGRHVLQSSLSSCFVISTMRSCPTDHGDNEIPSYLMSGDVDLCWNCQPVYVSRVDN